MGTEKHDATGSPPEPSGGRAPAARSPEHGQPDPAASSDGDGSWTDDPITADPGEDRSVDAVIERTSRDQ